MQELVEGIVQEFRGEVEQFFLEAGKWVKEGADGGLERWEQGARDRLQPIQRRLLEVVIKMMGKGYEGVKRPCPRCRQMTRYVNDRERTIQTVVGEVKGIRRSYYQGCRCGAGSFPLDEKLMLDREGRSPGLRRVISLAGSISPYEKTVDYLWEIGRIVVSGGKVERITEGEGERAREWLRRQESRGLSGIGAPEPERLYVQTDGTTVHTQEGWKEVKLGAVFASAGKDEDGQDRRGETRYTGGFETVDEFMPRLNGLARGAGAGKAREVVVLADGAAWIWKRVPELFANVPVIQIVDWYHAQERIWNIAHMVYGETSEQATQWAEKCRQKLWEGDVSAVIGEIKRLISSRSDVKEYVRQSVGYYQENKERMRYALFRRQGYFIGSGVIESACKHLVAQRLKQAGMQWNQEHAQKVLSLNLCRASGWWDQLWLSPKIRDAA